MRHQPVTSNAWRIALVLVGTVIGAGFASGAEIMAYFTSYGEAGMWSIGAAGLLFYMGTYGTLRIAYEHGNTEYGTFTETIAGKWLGALLDALVTLSMLLGYGVMLAGSGAIFVQQWNLPSVLGALIMAAGTCLALQFGPQGIMAVNRILTPILIIGIFLLSVYSIVTSISITETSGLLLQPLSIFTAQPVDGLPQALGSAVVYASYNMLGAGAVLAGLSGYVGSRRTAVLAGVYATVILVVLTLVLGLATFLNYDTIIEIPIPALALLQKHAFWQRVYVGVLLGAMYTTAVADGFGFANRMQALLPVHRGWIFLGMTAAALLLARVGFADLVAKGYRFFGYLGIGQLLLIMVKCIPKKEENIHGKQKRRNRHSEKLVGNRR